MARLLDDNEGSAQHEQTIDALIHGTICKHIHLVRRYIHINVKPLMNLYKYITSSVAVLQVCTNDLTNVILVKGST